LLLVKAKGIVALRKNDIQIILPAHRTDFIFSWLNKALVEEITFDWLSGSTGELSKEITSTLGSIDQSKISLLNRGRLSAFSFERLIKYLRILKQNVDIVIKARKGNPHSGVVKVL
jgi:predicted XRE-type DNA-binding protein